LQQVQIICKQAHIQLDAFQLRKSQLGGGVHDEKKNVFELFFAISVVTSVVVIKCSDDTL
jgi:hypothetical protein